MLENNKGNSNKEEMGWSTVGTLKESKGKNIGKISIFILICIIGVIVLALALINGNQYFQKKNVAVNNEDKAYITDKESIGEEVKGTSYEFTEYELYRYIHRMANTIIVPVDGKKIGAQKITRESIDKALKEAEGREPELYNELSKWLDLDFTNAVEVHNIVWKDMEGNIGKAIGLDNEAIEEVKKGLK